MAKDNGATPLLRSDTYINRELSTLAFQRRVLALATMPHIPLLERVKFLAIVGNNLDEFFMVRVAAYVQKIQSGVTSTRPDGLTPQQTLRRIREEVLAIIAEQRQVMNQVLAELAEHDIRVLKVAELPPIEREAVRAYFDEEVFPVLTPLAVDHARPFPFISNLSLNLAVILRNAQYDNDDLFARIKIPLDVLPRFISIKSIMQRYMGETFEHDWFVLIEDAIQDNLATLFPGMQIVESECFRVLRDADIDYESEREAEMLDVMSIIEQSVRERRFGSLVRVSVPTTISDRMMSFLLNGLEARPDSHVYKIEGMLGSANWFELASIDRPELKYPPYVPRQAEGVPSNLEAASSNGDWTNGSLFAAIRQGDILMHHPFDSFLPVEEFFRQAAHDPNVLAIKATLYRVGKRSPIVQALMEARDNGKQVTVLVELKARFDEENNLVWAKAMEAKGVHVIYGVEEINVKTHAKVSLVVRRDSDGVRRYLHLGTGNYNASTARLYTDLGLFTCDSELADDASRVFNRLTGFAPATRYNRLLVAPDHMLNVLLAQIDEEIEAARQGKAARLIFKMNQLEEDHMIQKLYEASQAGVQVDLIVRGLCCLRPGLEGISENIRVRSIVGRFLEHSRAYYFANAPVERQLYLGSADLMRRNLYNRVEVLFPILDARLRQRVLNLLATNLADNCTAWELRADQLYYLCQPAEGQTRLDAQASFMLNSFGPDMSAFWASLSSTPANLSSLQDGETR
ncbi:MAG: polyphosphate kinase 1 [Anaerolineae bacterium]|nr:polyphosphate kinase 1 [Anaerolineae bacterium]